MLWMYRLQVLFVFTDGVHTCKTKVILEQDMGSPLSGFHYSISSCDVYNHEGGLISISKPLS